MSLKDILAAATRGRWEIEWNGVFWKVVVSEGQPYGGQTICDLNESAAMWRDTDEDQPDNFAEANAALIALAPDMAAALIEAEKALALHQAWSDSEDAGPDYGDQTRATHPGGERIWRQWWEGNLSLCDRAQEATRAALATIRKVTT